MKKLIAIAIGVLFVGIIILATDFFLLWLPLAHSLEYPTKVAALFMAVTALVTLLLALVTVKATEQSNSREHERLRIEQQIRDEDKERNFRRRLLEDVFSWTHEASVSVQAIGIITSQKDLINVKTGLPAALAFFRDAAGIIDANKDFFGEASGKLLYEALDNFKAYVDLVTQMKPELSTEQAERIRSARLAIDLSLEHLKGAIIKLRIDHKI